MASLDDEAAAVLNAIPDDGAPEAQLAELLHFDQKRTHAAVQRLLNLKLVEELGGTIHVTPFAQKARKVFNITA